MRRDAVHRGFCTEASDRLPLLKVSSAGFRSRLACWYERRDAVERERGTGHVPPQPAAEDCRAPPDRVVWGLAPRRQSALVNGRPPRDPAAGAKGEGRNGRDRVVCAGPHPPLSGTPALRKTRTRTSRQHSPSISPSPPAGRGMQAARSSAGNENAAATWIRGGGVAVSRRSRGPPSRPVHRAAHARDAHDAAEGQAQVSVEHSARVAQTVPSQQTLIVLRVIAARCAALPRSC